MDLIAEDPMAAQQDIKHIPGSSNVQQQTIPLPHFNLL